MKFLIILSTLISFTALAHTNEKMGSSEAVMYANIYADQLIEEFDRELDNTTTNFFNMNKGEEFLIGNSVYSKILAARDYIENDGQVTKIRTHSILEVRDALLFKKVTSEINEKAI